MNKTVQIKKERASALSFFICFHVNYITVLLQIPADILGKCRLELYKALCDIL